MNRLGIAGLLWLLAAGFGIAMTIIFRVDPVQWIVTIAVAVAAAILGLWLIARPRDRVVAASNVVAVVWTALYAVLMRINPSPVVELNACVAIAMVDGPAPALRRIEALAARGALSGYPLLPAVRADLLRRLGAWPEAAAAYREALAVVAVEPVRRFLLRRLREVDGATAPD